MQKEQEKEKITLRTPQQYLLQARFIDVYAYVKFIQLYTLHMCSFLYVNYTLIPLENVLI